LNIQKRELCVNEMLAQKLPLEIARVFKPKLMISI
jgi:hypothetical protein